jgi:hypothetical protein
MVSTAPPAADLFIRNVTLPDSRTGQDVLVLAGRITTIGARAAPIQAVAKHPVPARQSR